MRADAAVPVMRRVGRGEETRMLPLACEKNSLVRHEDVVEEHYARRLPVLAREHGAVLTRSARRASHDRHARGVHGDRAADGEVGVLTPHVPARHDQEAVDVGGPGHDRLGTQDDDPVRSALDDAHVSLGHLLLVRALGAVALGVGHRDAERQVLILDLMQVGDETLMIVGALVGIDAVRRLPNRIERIVREIALRNRCVCTGAGPPRAWRGGRRSSH